MPKPAIAQVLIRARRVACVPLMLLACLGPSAAATVWTTHGPFGGIADQIVVDPKTPTTIYEASRGGGVFKSTNRGATWTRASTGLTEPLVYTLVINPVTPSILYAAGGNGVFRSTDGAAHWSRISFLVNVRQLAINPKTPATLYAVVSQSSLYKSTNAGVTWTSQFNQLQSQSLYSIVIDPVTPANVYVGGQGGVWRTSTAGAKWTLSTNGLGSGFVIVQTLAINPVNPKVLYAGTGTGLKMSTNAGVSWTSLSAAPSNLTLYAVDPSKPARLYGADYSGQIYVSANSGAAWTKAGAVATGFAGNIRTIAVDPKASAQVYAGTDHGVYSSTTSGAKWAEANNGLANTLVTSLALNPKTPAILYAGTEYGGIFKSSNAGASWSRVYADWIDKITAVQINPATPSTLYASSSFGRGVLKSVDAGATWTNPLPNMTVLAMAIDRSVPSTLYAATGGGSSTVLKSMNGAQTWVKAAAGLPTGGALQANSLSADAGAAVLTDPSNGGYVTTNAGASWTADDPPASTAATMRPAKSSGFFNLGVGFLDGKIQAYIVALEKQIAEDERQERIAFSKYLQSHSKSGPASPALTANWTPWYAPSTIDGSTCFPMRALAANPATPSTIYAGGLCGVVVGANYGAKSSVLGTGLPAGLEVDALAVTPDGKTVYAGLMGGGVYSLTP